MDNFEQSKRVVLSALKNEMRRATGPSGHLTNSIMAQLQRTPLKTRQSILNSRLGDWSPLSHACKNGLNEMVRFLCECGADPDLKSYFPVGEAVHFATPLWCAAVAGNLDIAKVLLLHGADVNCASDTGMTVLHGACSQTHLHLVSCLLEHAADTLRPNIRGETCLMNSVQSRSLCQLLLDNGADVNVQNYNGMTALHYAIERENYDTAELLIEKGADPCLKNSSGDDALRLASSKGSIPTCHFLFERMNLSPERIADSYDLLGAAYSDYNIAGTVQLWKISGLIRDHSNIQKQVLPPIRGLGFAIEFSSTFELDSLHIESSSIKLQSLLICQRILGLAHPVSMFQLLSCEMASVQSRRYQDAIPLLIFSLELTAANEPFVFSEMHSIVTELAKVISELFYQFPIAELKRILRYENACTVLTMIGDQIGPLIKLVSFKPVFLQHECIFNNVLQLFIKVLHAVLLISTSPEQRQDIVPYVQKIVLLNPQTTDLGLSLLHLALTTPNFCSHRSRELNPQLDSQSFTNFSVVQVLLECNAPVHDYSSTGLPPLYMAAFRVNYTKEVFELLLSHGAHPDQVNTSGETALDVLGEHGGGSTFNHLFMPPLKCLAARALRRAGRTFQLGELPRPLESFVAMH